MNYIDSYVCNDVIKKVRNEGDWKLFCDRK